MIKLLGTIALALLATPLFAAIQYEYMQKNTSPDVVAPTSDLTARVLIDGQYSRVEFVSGSMYPPGTYVVSSDGSRRLFFVDPAKQWFTEVNTAGFASTLGASDITIENFRSDLTPLGNGGSIAGLPTQHYRLTMSYDMTVKMKSIPLKQHIRTEIDSWTTMRFGQVQPPAISSGSATGNPQLDQLVDAEKKIPGFPLRQLVTIRTTFEMPVRSKLEVPTTKTITRETWVTKIAETAAQPSQFVVPASYRRADQPELKPAAQTLTFEPASN